MGDKYLANFEVASKNKKKSRVKKGDSCLRLDTFDIKNARDIILKLKERELTEKEKAKVMNVVRKMLNATKKEFGVCHGYYILLGAEYAEKIGKGGTAYVKNKLLNAYKKNPEMFDDRRVRDFFVRNREAATTFKNFRRKIFPKINFLAIISFVYFIVGLFFLGLTLTGYAVSGVGKFSASGVLGGILFVFGIFGFYISFRKKS